MADEFGDRMKAYEVVETSRRLDARLPIYARIDGRSFSTFTRGMKRPFDEAMSSAMIETMKYLVAETHAKMGYTQSDEISLIWIAEAEGSDVLFSGKVLKMVSVLASMAAAKFARVCPTGYEDKLPHFDCRVFQLPDRKEGANAFLWRAMDARKNAISMVAQAHFSPKKLHGKNQKDMVSMLAEVGIDFESMPGFFKHGTFAHRKAVERFMTSDELSSIPEAYRPVGPVIRTEIETFAEARMIDIENRLGFVFDGERPILRSALNA